MTNILFIYSFYWLIKNIFNVKQIKYIYNLGIDSESTSLRLRFILIFKLSLHKSLTRYVVFNPRTIKTSSFALRMVFSNDICCKNVS